MDQLKLENQMCFPLYAAAKKITRMYTPFLKELDLTYTQYLCMLVLWEKESLTSKELGNILYLDSGTLTPVINRLESSGYLSKQRDVNDVRNLVVTISDEGLKLRQKALDIPNNIAQCIDINEDEAINLYKTLYKILDEKEL